MVSPERLNVLLSRARNALILIGNAQTFIRSPKGRGLWTRFFDLLKNGGHIYDGFPVQCERHTDRRALLRESIDFETECPDGGCKEPCGTMLSCGNHLCPQRCHQLHDHSKMACEHILNAACPKGHIRQWKCHAAAPVACPMCEREAKNLQQRLDKAFEDQRKRDRKAQEHARQMADLQDQMDIATQNLRDQQVAKERLQAIQQKQKDVAAILALDHKPPTLVMEPKATAEKQLTAHDPKTVPQESTELPQLSTPADTQSSGPEELSSAVLEWQRQKSVESVSNEAIDAIMDMVGLEEVKSQILRIKSKVDLSLRQGTDVKGERFNVALLGNPGTGMFFTSSIVSRTIDSNYDAWNDTICHLILNLPLLMSKMASIHCLSNRSFRKNNGCSTLCQSSYVSGGAPRAFIYRNDRFTSC